MSRILPIGYRLVAIVAIVLTWAPPSPAESVARVHGLFAHPPCEYASAPLWVWNDMLTDEQITGTLRDLAEQKVMQVFVHPRPGLMTPYLSDEWFRLWNVALAEAERLGMNVWIYDENSYPSGFAGGFVPEEMPQARGRGLVAAEVKTPAPWSDGMLAVFELANGSCVDRTEDVRKGQSLPESQYLQFSIRRAPVQAWTANRSYVDLLYPGVVDKFIEVTHERYRREIGEHFGRRVPGIFTDEPQLVPAGGFPWTPELPDLFQKRWGYSLLEQLPALARPEGDWRRVRHNYFQLINELFIDRWGRLIYRYCEKHNLEFTGHYWEHEWPQTLRVPDNMAMYAWHQRPAIDMLMNDFREVLHAQFGNARAVKELSSVANQLNKKRTLCEAYGAGGWDLRFEDMKRLGDWIYVLGVNSMDEHLSFITIRGARKRDHPQSFSYHEPWWKAYHVCATYFSRLSAALSQGSQVNDVLVLEPTTTVWMYNLGLKQDPYLNRIGESFESLVRDLERHQVEYDLGCEDIIARHGSVENGRFVIGQRSYRMVVLPPDMENLNGKTMQLLERFLKGGGNVFCCGDAPARVDGVMLGQHPDLAAQPGWKTVSAAKVPALLREQAADTGFAIEPAGETGGQLYHHRRRLDDGEVLFLVNTSLKSPCEGAVVSKARFVEEWDLDTGIAREVACAATADGIRFDFELSPAGSRLFVLSRTRRADLEAARVEDAVRQRVELDGSIDIIRLDPNVLTIDYVDVTAAGETREHLNVIQAGHWIYQQHGMERNPWDRAVQFKDELITKRFPPDSGFEATYRFTIEEKVPSYLSIVIEQSDAYSISCNGQPVKADAGQWWLDRSFGRIDLSRVARVGENEVTIKASPFRIDHELEAAYVIGEFALNPSAKGFVIVPAESLQLGPWNEQGYPFYGNGVSYRGMFKVDGRRGPYLVELPEQWLGSVAEVKVNDRSAGYIWHQPWEIDVTDFFKPGDAAGNRIEVIVFGTLKNTLGPHHNNPPLGKAWPGFYDQAPADGPPAGGQYSTVGYGLFEPFVLSRVRK